MIKPSLKKKYRIVVIRGGRSNEREISLQTGANVEKALLGRGHQVTGMDLDSNLLTALMKKEFEVAFIALHGKWGEDGTLQGLLEILRIPYTGSGVLASALAMDKVMAKRIFENRGISTPKWRELSAMDGDSMKVPPFPFPLIVKPVASGSTVGASRVEKEGDFALAIQAARHHDSRILIEDYIEGREFTVGMIGQGMPFALPVAEIRSPGFFDYVNKYTPGRAEHVIPAPIDPHLTASVQDLAVKAHLALGCEGMSRVDLRADGDNRLYVLEVNTIPGMTDTSILPDQAKAAGIAFPDLAELLIQWALGG